MSLFERYTGLQIFGIEDVKQFLCQLLEALAYVHSMNIIHRDVKPENILCKMCGEQRTLVLCDFNLAVPASDTDCSTTAGTLAYMAPEMFRPVDYDFAVDVWSAGIVAYEWLYGHHPFYSNQGRDEFLDLLQNFCRNMPNSLILPEGQEFVVLRAMLATNPRQRIQAQQALNILRA